MIKCGLCDNKECIDGAEDTCIGFVPIKTKRTNFRTRIIDRCANSYGIDDLMTDCIHGLKCKRNCPKFEQHEKLTKDEMLGVE